MRKALIIIAILLLTGCMATVTTDDLGFIVYDGEPTLDESVKSWQEYEKAHP